MNSITFFYKIFNSGSVFR